MRPCPADETVHHGRRIRRFVVPNGKFETRLNRGILVGDVVPPVTVGLSIRSEFIACMPTLLNPRSPPALNRVS
ncbi:MAG: hypothetical protein CM1200mP20_04750 [Pseudomonadota bacterium]|nr:MAG: hypothetical protein CM1200mP20_04750 [Pseudomonadota bacterium]